MNVVEVWIGGTMARVFSSTQPSAWAGKRFAGFIRLSPECRVDSL
jgi:hypothetical protein